MHLIGKKMGGEELVERAKFAQFYVEIDLRKHFLAKFKLLKWIYQVEYDRLYSIYF